MSENSYKRFRCPRCKKNSIRIYRSFFPRSPMHGDKVVDSQLSCRRCGLVVDSAAYCESHDVLFREEDYPAESAKQRETREQRADEALNEMRQYRCPSCERTGIGVSKRERLGMGEGPPRTDFRCEFCQAKVVPRYTSSPNAPGHEEHSNAELGFVIGATKTPKKGKKKKR